ncbi:histone-lysine N-methyltransferase SETMAR [Trichonephila clavipes]|nr:histone-lysine N-methyltransferase SETMAR [Trichonephila clavipes]
MALSGSLLQINFGVHGVTQGSHHKLSALNHQLQESNVYMFDTSDKINAFCRKLELWRRNLNKKNLERFENVHKCVKAYKFEEQPKEVVFKTIENHLARPSSFPRSWYHILVRHRIGNTNCRSPDLTPSVFHLFLHLKSFLAGKHFNNDKELKENVSNWLKTQAATFYEEGIEKLVPRYSTCLQNFGSYVERTATASSDVVQSGRPIFDDFFQHLWPYIGNNMANAVTKRVFESIDCGTSCVTCCAVLLEPQLLDIMIVQFRNEKVSNHGSIPITIDCNVVAFIVFEEGFHQPIKRTKQSVFLDVTVFRYTLVD